MITRRQLLLFHALAFSLITTAQPQPARKARPAPTVEGLKILHTVLEAPSNVPGVGLIRQVAVTVQNVSDKTIVAHVFVYREFDEAGMPVGDPAGAGSGIDYAGPDTLGTENFIRPGQVTTMRMFSVGNPETDSVKVTVGGIVYDDRSSEGNAAQMFFITRQTRAREAREAAAKETGEKKVELEKRAEWYEAHGPLEAQQ